jgi:hypothetical protein
MRWLDRQSDWRLWSWTGNPCTYTHSWGLDRLCTHKRAYTSGFEVDCRKGGFIPCVSGLGDTYAFLVPSFAYIVIASTLKSSLILAHQPISLLLFYLSHLLDLGQKARKRSAVFSRNVCGSRSSRWHMKSKHWCLLSLPHKSLIWKSCLTHCYRSHGLSVQDLPQASMASSRRFIHKGLLVAFCKQTANSMHALFSFTLQLYRPAARKHRIIIISLHSIYKIFQIAYRFTTNQNFRDCVPLSWIWRSTTKSLLSYKKVKHLTRMSLSISTLIQVLWKREISSAVYMRKFGRHWLRRWSGIISQVYMRYVLT